MISMFVFIIVSDFQFYKLDPSSFDAVFLVVGLYFIILAFISFDQVKRAFKMQKINADLETNRLEMGLKLKEAELKLLRSQIHPHFLFNTLNNLYGLTLEKSDLAPELVLKLSNLMDYMLYKCNKSSVNLKQELEYLSNYVEIERIRYDDKIKFEFLIEGQSEQLQIAPMLLLAFFENAFKHGVSKSISNPFVQIHIQIEEHTLKLNLTNSKNESDQKKENYTKGIGLKNVKKRLQLLYPNKHNLEISSKAHTFEIDLKLNLEEDLNQKNAEKWTN